MLNNSESLPPPPNAQASSLLARRSGGAPQRGRSLLLLVTLPQFPLCNCWRKKSPKATALRALSHGAVSRRRSQRPRRGWGWVHRQLWPASPQPCQAALPHPAHFHRFLAEGRRCRSEAGSSVLCACLRGAPAPATAVPVRWQRSGLGPSREMREAVCPKSAFPNLPGQGDPVLDPPKFTQGPFLPRVEEQCYWMHTIKGKPYFPAHDR